MEFDIGVPIRVYVAYQSDIVNPLSNNFVLTDMQIALLQIKTTDEAQLMEGKQVIAQEDVAMEIR